MPLFDLQYQNSLFATYHCCIPRSNNETWLVHLWIFAQPLSLWSVFLSYTSYHEWCSLLQQHESLVHVPFSVWAWSLTIDVSDCSIFLLSMKISSTADWQGPLLVFLKLDQAFENNKCCNIDTDFQRNSTFSLVSSKLNWTRRRKYTKKVTRC